MVINHHDYEVVSMTDLETLQAILNDGDQKLAEEETLVDRELLGTLRDRAGFEVVEVAMGVRRSGKSTLLLMVGRELRKSGRRVYYLNFEDERLMPEPKDLTNLTSMMDLEGAVMIADEPQNMIKWERWVRRMHDRKVKVYLSGSNSKLLGGELATALSGRKLTHQVFTLSYREFMKAQNRAAGWTDQDIRGLEEYLVRGGFPYPTVKGDYAVLAEYRNDIIEKDILARYGIRNPQAFRDLCRFILSNPGLTVSMRSVSGLIRISNVTLRKYMDHLVEAYALIPLEKFSRSQKERLANPKKYYPMDNGLIINTPSKGRLLEACILQHLSRLKVEVFYWKDDRGREIDFYIPARKLAVQVVYELRRENIDRECRALESAKKQLGAEPLMVYMYANAESGYPTMRAPEFLEWIEKEFAPANV